MRRLQGGFSRYLFACGITLSGCAGPGLKPAYPRFGGMAPIASREAAEEVLDQAAKTSSSETVLALIKRPGGGQVVVNIGRPFRSRGTLGLCGDFSCLGPHLENGDEICCCHSHPRKGVILISGRNSLDMNSLPSPADYVNQSLRGEVMRCQLRKEVTCSPDSVVSDGCVATYRVLGSLPDEYALTQKLQSIGREVFGGWQPTSEPQGCRVGFFRYPDGKRKREQRRLDSGLFSQYQKRLREELGIELTLACR